MYKNSFRPASIHFQLLLVGAVISIGLFVWLATPHYASNGGEAQILHNSEAILDGVRIVDGDVTFASIVVGYRLFRD